MNFQSDVVEIPPAWLNDMEKSLSAVPESAHKSDSERAAHARRREQVRRAQRNHRQRKEKYIKDVEAEVIRLRQYEAVHEETLAIRQENEILKELLAAHNIPLPSNVSSRLGSPLSVSVFDQPDGSQDLRATISPLAGYASPTDLPSEHGSGKSPFSASSTSPFVPVSDTLPVAPQSTMHQAAPSEANTALQHPASSLVQSQAHEMDSSQIALDFVLGLEQPCLSHHRTHSFPDGETNGHALMIQSPILSRCPAPISTESKSERIDPPCTWSAPALEVQKLLALSSRLTLDGEITPVEAWRRITNHPGFRYVEKENVEALKEMILPEVMCYGFGAVIDEAYFEVMIQQYFSQVMSSPIPKS